MLEAQTVACVLNKSLKETGMLAYAVVSMDGIVLESREQRTKPTDIFPQHSDVSVDFQVSSKLQTKVYGLFAAEFWRQSSKAQWVGAEAHERRLVVCPFQNEPLLLLVVGKSTQSWGEISCHAIEVANKFI